MLESLETTSPKLSKEEYKQAYDPLIKRLVLLQQRARKHDIGLVVLFEGWKGAGKGSRISDLMYHLDARDASVYVTEDFDSDEARRVQSPDFGASGYYPVMQQFWKALGTRGSFTFYDRGWYSLAAQHLISQVAGGKKKDAQRTIDRGLFRALPSIESFERQLITEGYLVVKFFLHISEETQRDRLTKLANNPATSWRVSKEDLRQIDDYEQTYRIYDELLSKSNFGSSEWVVLNAEDKRRVNLKVVSTLVDVLEAELAKQKSPEDLAAEAKAKENSSHQGEEQAWQDERHRSEEENARLRAEATEEALRASAQAPRWSKFPIVPHRPSLDGVDQTLALSREDYKKQLKVEQEKLFNLELEMYIKRIPMILMYEGWDAAGKGGNIKRVAQALDARSYTIFPSPAPSRLELAHPHLWRYWTRLPKAGHVGIYDRSWYGRVLVERVEGFASPAQWAAAYDEINDFERDLVNWGAILLKFWVDISPEVQLERFEARENNPEKAWKITAEDWRNRDKYPQYRAAVEDMFRLTSTHHAPWILLESNDKYYARVKALRLINEALEQRLKDFR